MLRPRDPGNHGPHPLVGPLSGPPRPYEPLPLYITAGLLYFGITLVGVHILRVLERKVHIPGYAVSGSM